MSMQLYIEYHSSIVGIREYDPRTIDFQADGYKVLDGFFPETPDEGAESVTDQFAVLIIGSSASDLRTKITAISQAFEHAREHKDDAQSAWLYFDVDDSGDAWMSKLLGGEVIYNSQVDRNWRQNKCVATVIVEHMPYWDAQDEVQVPLTNGNGTSNITGLTVFNHDDGGGASPNHHDNWVEIWATDVLGDMLCPTRLEILNTYATGKLYTIWIGQNWTDPANITPILEGESSTMGTETDDTDCSNAHYMRAALASGAEDDLFSWALTNTFLSACQGKYFKIMARWNTAPYASIRYRLKLKYSTALIWQSGQITLDSSRAYLIRDLFTLRLPPWLVGQINLSALSMTLTGQQNSGVSKNIDLDFLQFTALDGWRMLECAGFGVDQNSRMVDDGVMGNAYIDDGAGHDKLGIVVGYGNPICLFPGKAQRLYFLMHSSTTNLAQIDRTIAVKLFYHPRRKTL